MWGTLRAFGLDYDDFPTMVNNVNVLLRMITIDIYKKSKPIPFVFYITTLIGVVTYLYSYIFSMMWIVVFYYGRTDRWTEASVLLSLGMSTFTCVTKFAFMKLYAKDIKETVHSFLKCNAQVSPNTRFAANLKKALRVVKRRAIIMWITFIVDVGIYMILPYMRPGRHFTTDLYTVYGFSSMFESPYYELATFINACCIFNGVHLLLSISTYVIVIVGYIEAQMLALSIELRNIWVDSEKFYNEMKYKIHNRSYAVDIKENIMNEFIRVNLRDIIKFHIANINLLHKLNYALRPKLAFEFSILAFSITAELLGGLEHTYLQIPFTVVQIFMDCFIGQRLIDSCNDFEDAVYSCKWENFNAKNQKTVLVMLKMSQKTLFLSAGGVATLDYRCLMSILKSAYSAYTTLKTNVE